MFTYQGKTALITGASSGIGRAFAHALARRGMSVVLVARSEERLHALATELSQRHGIRTEVIPADLSQEDAIHQIQGEVQQRGLVIDLLINNAGFATNGYFETLSPERDHEQVMVDVTAVVDLTHAFIPVLLERSPGAAIINVASTAGFQPLQDVGGKAPCFEAGNEPPVARIGWQGRPVARRRKLVGHAGASSAFLLCKKKKSVGARKSVRPGAPVQGTPLSRSRIEFVRSRALVGCESTNERKTGSLPMPRPRSGRQSSSA